ncbi:galactose oxidase/kelch repeat superfamily protein [Artemisia annua]|uniref:Galactose oxidase/kelch repeat superfamily protein n=1 Tax=Artemisia annua TaxID=35608 RepID=A0A2U1KDH1_ARTAN|nr:galactose oxidase/kelch repeat superfamily protein [Artemisia annua]
MLEERSFMVSRFTSKRENTWFMSNCRIERIESHEKRPLELEDEEVVHARKICKQSSGYDNLELGLGFLDLTLVPIDHSNNNQRRHSSDDSDSSSLIHSIGRDNSISCLLKCSRSTYGCESFLIGDHQTAIKFQSLGMLEERSFMVSRFTSKRENTWFMSNCRIERIESHEKRPLELEDEEVVHARKICKQSSGYDNLELGLGFLDLTLVPIDHSNNNQRRHNSDDSDSSSLIHSIGRDNSISCLLKCSRSTYGSLASLNSSFRDLIRSGELYRLRRKNGIIEHWVYFSCHLVQWEAFDPINQLWMHLPTMSSNTCFQFSDKESLAVGTELLVLGKEVLDHVIYKYSLLTNSWSLGQLMNEPRCLFGSASLGEIAIVAGGVDPNGKIVSSAELYNSESGSWETLPNMLKPRKMCSGVFMDNKFYVIGGVGGTDSRPLTCGEEYDLTTRVWTEIPNMSPVRPIEAANAPAEAPPLVAVVDNELYAADCVDMEVRKYDKQRKEWETVGRLPERADSMNGWGIAFRGCGDRVIVIGGPRTSGAGFIEVNSWVPRDGPPRWTMLGRKQSSNFVYNCAVMGC